CKDPLGDDPASEDARDGAKPRPRRVAREPESRDADVVGDRALVRVGEAETEAADRAARARREPLEGPGRSDLEDDGPFAEPGVDAPRQSHETLAGDALAFLVLLLRQSLP